MLNLKQITEGERNKLSWVLAKTRQFLNSDYSMPSIVVVLSDQQSVFLPEAWAYLWHEVGTMMTSRSLKNHTQIELFDMIYTDLMMRRIVAKAQLQFQVKNDRDFKANREG